MGREFDFKYWSMTALKKENTMYDEYPNFKKTSQKLVNNQHFKKIYMKVSEDYFYKNEKAQH